MSVTRRRVARTRHHACGGYCPPIQPGDVYLEHVAFPGEDAMDDATQPWRIRECADCASRYGRAHLLAPVTTLGSISDGGEPGVGAPCGR